MRKSLSRLFGALVGALAAAAMFWRESSHITPGYMQFAGLPESIAGAQSSAEEKEMIEIQRETQLASLIKVHPPEHPNKPISGLLGNNCYVGSDMHPSSTLETAACARHELCIGSELDTNPNDEFHEQNQLKALSCRAIRR